MDWNFIHQHWMIHVYYGIGMVAAIGLGLIFGRNRRMWDIDYVGILIGVLFAGLITIGIGAYIGYFY
jgi:hypothetical protein